MEANLPTIPGQQYEKCSENTARSMTASRMFLATLDKAFFAFPHELLISQKDL